MYHSARQNPESFFIGIDPNARPLEKISEKIHRKPSRGGASNALYVLASAENIPVELNGISNEVHVHFPWGSLLRGVAVGDPDVMNGLRRICKPGATLRIVLSLDLDKDRSEMTRLELPVLAAHPMESVLRPRYREAGFEIQAISVLSQTEFSRLQTSWARRLRNNNQRTVFKLIARAR